MHTPQGKKGKIAAIGFFVLWFVDKVRTALGWVGEVQTATDTASAVPAALAWINGHIDWIAAIGGFSSLGAIIYFELSGGKKRRSSPVEGTSRTQIDIPATINITLSPDQLQAIVARQKSEEVREDPIASRTFRLLAEPGATLLLGPCPGPYCAVVRLESLSPAEMLPPPSMGGADESERPERLPLKGKILAEFFVDGEGFGIIRGKTGMLCEASFNNAESKFSEFAVGPDGVKVRMLLVPNACFRLRGLHLDLLLSLIDLSVDSLRLRADVLPGTHRSGRPGIPPAPRGPGFVAFKERILREKAELEAELQSDSFDLSKPKEPLS